MAQRQKLTVHKRDITGVKIKKLRREGIMPANLYGKDIPSISIQTPYKDFETLFKHVGQTGLFDVEVEGKLRPVLVKNVQREPVSKNFLHADLFQVNLKEKIAAMIPVVTIGEPKAVTEKVGLLLQPVSEIEVEALPEDLPEKIEINVEPLAAVDDQVTVADIKVPTGVTILTDPAQVLIKIAELISEDAKEVAAEMAKEAETAAVTEAAEEAANAEEVKPARNASQSDAGEEATEAKEEEKTEPARNELSPEATAGGAPKEEKAE